jgi:hypothetical protein
MRILMNSAVLLRHVCASRGRSELYIFITFLKGRRPVNSTPRAMVDVMDQSEDPGIITRYTTPVNTAISFCQPTDFILC